MNATTFQSGDRVIGARGGRTLGTVVSVRDFEYTSTGTRAIDPVVYVRWDGGRGVNWKSGTKHKVADVKLA